MSSEQITAYKQGRMELGAQFARGQTLAVLETYAYDTLEIVVTSVDGGWGMGLASALNCT